MQDLSELDETRPIVDEPRKEDTDLNDSTQGPCARPHDAAGSVSRKRCLRDPTGGKGLAENARRLGSAAAPDDLTNPWKGEEADVDDHVLGRKDLVCCVPFCPEAGVRSMGAAEVPFDGLASTDVRVHQRPVEVVPVDWVLACVVVVVLRVRNSEPIQSTRLDATHLLGDQLA